MEPPKTRFTIVEREAAPVKPLRRKGHLTLVSSNPNPEPSEAPTLPPLDEPEPKPNPKASKRDPYYIGPKLDIEPQDLDKYEKTGKWIAEPKIDGMWARMIVGAPEKGRPHILTSRDANTAAISGANLGDLATVQVPWPEGAILVGELEAATEWATLEAQKKGYRTFHIFDLAELAGRSTALIPWNDRRELLNMMMLSLETDLQRSRFNPLPVSDACFRKFYDGVVDAGGEGIVLKAIKSPYSVANADGKADFWVRCKRWLTGDYVLMEVGKTPSGVPTGVWGLYKGGKLKRTMQAACPGELLTQANVGVLVAEFKGWAKFKSGALRHASFVRVRTDKTAEQCTL